ncbi:hypothetical protein OAT84_02010 [Gammaproteobacteria bacterium]|nr:hypothetical protein [Gammaproteobacteria bacterium]
METLIIDVMGGDNTPHEVLRAVEMAAKQYSGIKFVAVGKEDHANVIKQSNVEYIAAPEVVLMNSDPMQAARLGTQSSLGKCIDLVGRDTKSMMLTAGNTAALMSLAYLKLRQKEGKRRPALMSRIEFMGRSKWILDLGANILSTAEDLRENAIYGSLALSPKSPVIGLLNVGTEESKGTPLIKEAHKLIQSESLNYHGFIEGSDVLTSKVDLIVCNGLEGNMMTKLLESAVSFWKDASANAPNISNAALLIGLRSVVYKAHGASKARDIKNAIDEMLMLHCVKPCLVE